MINTIMGSDNRLCFSPFRDLLVGPEHAVLDVYGVISHASQDQSLVQGPDNKDGVMIF